jgi:putative acetyltransferase
VIRSERESDYAAIRALHKTAFAPSEVEAGIVDELRAAGDHVPELCLVALDDDGAVVGHVMLSEAAVEEHRALGLGPIAVAPARRRRGFGAALMYEAIRRARDTDYTLIALLGHPGYYARFGFAPAAETFGVTSLYDAPPEAWMALALPAYDPSVRGTFRYAAAFGGGGGT